MLRFGVFTDVHYAPLVHGNRYCRDSLDKLATCVDTFNVAELSLALCLGDIVGGSLNQYAEQRFSRMVAQTAGAFHGPVHWVVGNHDVQTMTKVEFLETVGQPGRSPFYSFDVEGVHFAVLDGNCHADGRSFANGDFDWEHTWVAPDQVSWLAADLRSAADRPAIVVCHECLDEIRTDTRIDPHIVGNRLEVRGVIEAAGNVRAVLHGHYHYGRRMLINGIPYLTFVAMVVDPGLENNAFAVVTLQADGQVGVAGYGRQPSYRFVGDGFVPA